MIRTRSCSGPSLGWTGFLIGFALSGFFDGILLHQVLQWHHLLSAVEAVRDLRGQILADGLFHTVMYLVAAVALVRLWRQRASLGDARAAATLWIHALVGFGVWHLLDGVLSHWVLGIHRIRMDSAHPLAWDLAWFVVFGVVPALAGWLAWRRHRRGAPPGGGPGGGAVAAALAITVTAAGAWALQPARGLEQTVVVFAPGVPARAAFDALAEIDARVTWVDRSGGVWAVRLTDPRASWRLYRRGALLVSNAGASFGCLAWTRPAAAAPPAATG